MKLQTQIPLEKAKPQIDYESRLLLLGSCFVENIGAKLDYFKFQSVQNPFGILFHPLAIENVVTKAIDKYSYTEKDLFFLNERWHCFDVHSDLSDVSKEDLLQNLNSSLHVLRKQIEMASHIVITLGTAWVYHHKERKITVANCHKVPQKEFDKKLLEVPEVLDSLKRIVHQIGKINKTAAIVYTVSPVRHLKDGFVENQRSKAHLVTAIHKKLSSPFFGGGRGEAYFPSYEIMMDELRDYRFYKADMVHPNDVAIDYIWEKFTEVWISGEAQSVMKDVASVQKGLAHRPFNIHSNQYGKFTAKLENLKQKLQERYPKISFD
ncbi:GSCFA domain-containing protein [Maribacter sp. 2210JD10-5]|uniref:GSCFA domain-containing protein n=1 Tax=Maribacter sp. 2210JD10-5 TaxID=3386272 RepID=UPI0039BCE6A2